MQCWDRSAYDHEEQLCSDPSEYVVCCPGLIGAVRELHPLNLVHHPIKQVLGTRKPCQCHHDNQTQARDERKA
jgi:hypothetical protein